MKEAGTQLQSHLATLLGLIPYKCHVKFGIYKKLGCYRGSATQRVIENFPTLIEHHAKLH